MGKRAQERETEYFQNYTISLEYVAQTPRLPLYSCHHLSTTATLTTTCHLFTRLFILSVGKS